MKKQLAVIGAIAAVSTAGLAGIQIANAASTSQSGGPMSSLVDALASKFNLNKSDVQAVFDEQHDKMEAERETQIATDVAQLVKDGKLTQAQADKLNAKRAEMQKERDAMKDSIGTKTHEEMKAEMDAKRTALEAWAKENGIDSTYLRYVMGGGHGHGFGGPGGLREMDAAGTQSTTN